MKHCPHCNTDKDNSQFSKNKSAYDGLSSWCKLCNSEYQKTYYPSYVDNNRKKLKKYHFEYNKKHYQENKSKLIKQKIEYHNKRYQTDIEFRLTSILRSRLNKAITKPNKTKSAQKLVGCSIEQLKQHLESQFQPGMTWDNHGMGIHGKQEWHIDHIKPCAKFDLSKESEQRACFNYTNLQPLWADENRNKGSKT